MESIKMLGKTIKISIIIVAVFLFSCNKDATIEGHVEGIVFDYYSKQPAKNIQVSIIKMPKDRYSLTLPDTLSKCKTDDQGHFSFNFNNLRLIVEAEDNVKSLFPGNLDTAHIMELKNGNNIATLYVRQAGNFLLKLKSTNPKNNEDKIHFWGNYGFPKEDFYGMSVNESFDVLATCNITNLLWYEVTKNGVAQGQKNISVFVPLGSKPVVELKY